MSEVGPGVFPASASVFSNGEQQAAAYKRIVKKEPKYECDYPFHGVFKYRIARIRLRASTWSAKNRKTQPT